MGLQVPGDAWKKRPQLGFAHRMFYQTRVHVPADSAAAASSSTSAAPIDHQRLRQRSLCRRTAVGARAWDLDVTRCVRPGQDNVITVGVKGPYYAMFVRGPAGRGKGDLNPPAIRPAAAKFPRYVHYVDAVFPASKGEGDGMEIGLLRPVKFVVAGPAYASDVFIRPSVAKKRLDADVEIANPGDQPLEVAVACTAVNDKTGRVEKTFAA